MRVHCPVSECTESYVYHTSLETHLISKHNYSKENAAIALAEAKANAVRLEVFGDNFGGEIIPVLLDLETTRLIRRNAPLPKVVEIALKVIRKRYKRDFQSNLLTR